MNPQQRADLLAMYAARIGELRDDIARDRTLAEAQLDGETIRDLRVIDQQLAVGQNCARAASGASLVAIRTEQRRPALVVK